MARIPEGVDLNELTVVARRVLLDALQALYEHSNAIVLVGAQAVHLRTTGVVLTGSPYTSDADLSLNPKLIRDEPLLNEAMRGAGFELTIPNSPGLWTRMEMINGQSHPVEVDLLVPETLAPNRGRRSAHLPPHDKNATRHVLGLEATLFDHSSLQVPSLEPGSDSRELAIEVAGPTSLLIAKAFKLRDRLNDRAAPPHRLADKDAGDVVRLMMATGDSLRSTFKRLSQEEQIRDVVAEGCELLWEQFGSARATGVQMAVRALAGDLEEGRIRLLAPAFVEANVPEL
ncbi:hypothetical protein [Streptosporangium sp. NPDC006930]|uniref:hypothetical protein n=1 Tax=unclassified Streptosporangium TaxID=2632669 RepID=UPI003432D6E5